MIETELLHDRAQVVSHADLTGIVPTSATCTLRKATGATLQTPAVTLPTVSTTVAAGTTTTVLKVASAAGIAVGQPLTIVNDGETIVVEPMRIDGVDVTLAAAMPVVPDTGATVKGLRMAATVTAVGLAEIGSGLQLEWRYSSATQDGFATQEVSVVRWLWQDPITASEVSELLATVYQTSRSVAFCRGIADRVSAKIRLAIEQTGRRPYLFASPGAFAEVAQIGARWILAESNISLLGSDPAELLREYRFAFNDELGKAVAGLRGYDSTAEGRLDQPKRNVLSIPTVR